MINQTNSYTYKYEIMNLFLTNFSLFNVTTTMIELGTSNLFDVSFHTFIKDNFPKEKTFQLKTLCTVNFS